MELWRALGFSLIFASLTQLKYTQAQDCSIISITSPSASSLYVRWNQYVGATNYFLDLRVVNATSIAPVVVTVPASSSQKIVRGLRPGTVYSVTVKVFQFFNVRCLASEETITVPATSQLTVSRAVSSTAITFEWSSVKSSNRYFLIVETTLTKDRVFNQSFTSLSGEVQNLQPSTTYNCFVYSSNAAGLGARSRVRTVTTLVQPPGVVSVAHTGRSTAHVTWESVPKVLLYEITIADTDNPSSAPIVRNTSLTYLDIFNLDPCSTYRIGVSSVNAFLVPGEATYTTYTTKNINAVSSISVSYSCSSGMATVSWNAIVGANSYRAMATDGNGTTLHCTTTSDSCQITRVKCGERYMVRVTAISEDCESTSNVTTYFETVPCAPVDLDIFRECSSNVIVFSWAPTNNTAYYVATALDDNGEVTECRTTDSSCLFTNTGCGRRYQYTVYSIGTVGGLCSSEISPPVYTSTAPCDPTNVKTLAQCQSEVLITTWDTAAGALSYVVEAHGNLGDRYNCSSHTNSCAITGVRCGQSLSVWITATDDECTSSRVMGEVAETVPCTPQNVTAIEDCGSDYATIDWEVSAGALFYIASAVNTDGTVHSCSSIETQCTIQGLRCGQIYTASVVATNLRCNSTESARVTLETAPCPPVHVEAILDCEANHAVVMWQDHHSNGTYTATMQDNEGGMLSCMTSGNNCPVSDLKCGQKYTVSVQYYDTKCSSLLSAPIQMDSVPCGPENVRTSVDCGTGELTVGWDVSVPGQNYTTIVSTGNGERIHCDSTETHCSISTLECGRSYIVVVLSVNGTCRSMPSRDVIIQEAPCVPTNVTAERVCGESAVTVRWGASRGAIRYTAIAVGSSGHRSECSSNGTACDLPDLVCDEMYTVGVFAEDDNCTSLQSQTVTLQTVPCAPSSVGGWVDCASNTAHIYWTASPNAVSYSVLATAMDGHSHSCDSSSPSCPVTDLHCGEEYAFTVIASDGSCHSPPSVPFIQGTVPCAPKNVTNHLYCGTNVLEVSWDSDVTPLNYSATARAADGTVLSCSSGDTSCQISDLLCGQRYNLTVMASNSICTGLESAMQTVQTAPCAPLNVHGEMQCGTDILLASWDGAPGASAYVATVTGPNSYSEACDTVDLSCSFGGLRCAQNYAITLVARDHTCNSSASPAVSLMTAPCDPENVAALLHCDTDAATVSWDTSMGASGYTVVAQGKNGQTGCRTTETSCQLSQLVCGEMYNVTVLAEDGACNSTWKTSAVILTAPCPPTITDNSLDCATNVASLTWEVDSDMAEVIINATSVLGHMTHCSSSNATCQLTDLQCGHTYTVVATAMGDHCLSGPSSGVEIVTAPCAPAMVITRYDCNTNIVIVTWDESLGRDTFEATVEGGHHYDSCNTAGTTCSFSGLQCGQAYNVSVRALASHCNSSLSFNNELHTVPCAPQNVSASLVCADDTALVTWEGSEGATMYNTSVLGRDGDSKYCYTNATSCHIPGMHCGETYVITVAAYSDTCMGFHSMAYTYTAGPCPPSNVAVALECDGNIGSVYWDPALAAEMYIATAIGQDGHTHNCTTTSTSCSFTDLHCGELYSVTVVTVDRGCLSAPSAGVALKSAICPPTNLVGMTSCENNTLSLSWDAIPGVGVVYFLHSRKWGGDNATYAVTGTSHSLQGLQCGECYSFWLSARDATCNSSLTEPLQIDAAPCPPTDLAVRVDCGSNRGTISWEPSVGESAVSYTVEAVGVHGHRASCTSNSTSCWLKLDCGHRYTATVSSSAGACNSSANSIEFDSAPCLPEDVVADLDCNTNVLAVQWRESPGSDSYTALAIGSDGYRASCNTSSMACNISDLRCGQTYNITVTTSSVNCSIIQGSDYQVHSAPCQPQSPAVNLNCTSNEAVVSWTSDDTAQMHSVTAVDHLGNAFSCNTSDDSCTFSQLSCGMRYTFSMVGMTNQCRSDATPSMELLTAPCVPTHVMAHYDCATRIAMISWDAALGANMYMVLLEGSRGHNTSCNNTDTMCVFPDLTCGQDYTVTVMAMHDGCATFASEPANFSTGPCPHSQLQASLDCSSNSALVSWMPGNGTLSYNASAEALSTGHSLFCTTNTSACNISDLHCGQRYRISVMGISHTCPSQTGSWIAVNTAPCPPTQLSMRSSCDSDTVSVSWATAVGAISYVATAEASDGHQRTCNSSGTACDITGLECGREYMVSVRGVDDDCDGVKSEVQMLTTAPCMPQSLETHLECPTGDLSVTWQSSRGALEYHVVAEGSMGDIRTCDTANATCAFPGLPCSQTYNVTVMANGDTCNSSNSMASLITTAPCPPPIVDTTVDCPSNGNLTVRVKIDIRFGAVDPSTPGALYTARAEDALGHYSTCNTTDSSCYIQDLQCGTEYNVAVTGSMDDCAGPPSISYTVRTAPCTPHLVEVEMDCLADSASVVWESSEGASLYNVAAQDGLGGVWHCGSDGTGCVVTGLHCGQTYDFSLTASDGRCNSSQSNIHSSETAPCPPQNVQAYVSCENRTADVSWDSSQGALRYTATLQGTDGQTASCISEGTSCEVTGLHCGETYTVTVVAEGRSCNSSSSIGFPVRTAPCIPQNLRSNTSCVDGVAVMTWSLSKGAPMYTVEATSRDGHTASCRSIGASCDLTGLLCGRSYDVTVSASHANCSSSRSQPVTVTTVPCMPEDVWTMVDCETNTMTVSWSESDGAEYYTATLQDSYTHSTNCQSVGSRCNVTALRCGETYHVTVMASDSLCSSAVSPVTNGVTAPCLPSRIEANMDCLDQTATVSWHYSAGALSYTAEAQTQSGHSVTCDTNHTNCVLTGLTCGEQYSVSVQAQGETCNSTAEMSGHLTTEPCVPLNLNVHYSQSIGQLLWDSARGATSYTGEAVTEQGLSVVCNTTDTNCVLRDMACGQVYNITVTAHNEVCNETVTSDTFRFTTEPCPPENVQARLDCENGEGLVSWEQSEVAVGYIAFLEGRNGDSIYCSTTETFCSAAGLQCGTVYVVRVRAIGEEFNSTDSATFGLTTAPCVPDSAAAHVDCEAGTAMISWSFSTAAESYTATVESASGHRANCTTQDMRCNVTELSCGETYNLTLTSTNEQCQILSATGVTFQTRPCAPLRVSVDLQCGTRTAALAWESQDEVDLYTASGVTRSGTPTAVCSSTDSTCLLSSLSCGETYTFTVTAHSGLCHSELSDSVEITTEPCRPERVTAQGVCSNETLILDWDEPEGALHYIVSAVGNLGYVNAFNASGNTLEEQLPCGQTYNISVVAQDDRCDSAQSDPTMFTTAPCVPQSLQSHIRCEADMGSVTWAGSDGADHYMAVAMGQDRHTHICTTNGTSCTWSDLHCGEVYTVHVVAQDNICTTSPSSSALIHTAPCVPQDLVPTFDCGLKVASLTWNASQGADLYIVTAESGDGNRMELSTNETVAHFSEFTCGQVYSLTVTAVNQECRSAQSQPVRIQTEPCAPTDVTTEPDCVSNIVAVTWAASNGSDYYTAMVQTAGGEAEACMSSDTWCGISSLSCGQTYSVYVTASNQQCNSTPSAAVVSLATVPCPPSLLSVELNCADNTAVASWNHSQGALSYRATAESSRGSTSICESSDLHCTLANLTCGVSYSVRLQAIGENCSSLQEPPMHFQTVPCTPEITMADLDCFTNSALLEWHYAEGAVSYTVVAESGRGDVSLCFTNHTNCEIVDMACGQVYTVTMVASDGHCNSSQSATWEIASVPCAPQNVAYQLDCGTNSAHVEWEGSSGVESYVVRAVGSLGHVASCNTTGLSCDVPDLMCGCTYNISVSALNNNCNISESAIIQLHTVPCTPNHVQTSLDCETGTVSLSWEHSYGAISYTAVAQGNGGYASYCNTSDTVCQFHDLLCGMTYSFTVSASDDECTSAESSSEHQTTVLCKPQNVSADLDCSSHTGLVAWEYEEGVDSYYVLAVGPDGHLTQCNTTTTSCRLDSLHCGQLYNLTVTAQDGVCDNSNAFLTLQSGPCEARNVETTFKCASRSASVSWGRGSGAFSYEVEGESANGHQVSCNTSATSCDLEGLQCGQTYSVSVISLDDSCSSVGRANADVQTAPCPPLNVEAEMSCDSGTLVVTWDPSSDAESFHVVAVTNGGPDLSCDTNSTQCFIGDLPCGQTYSVTVTASRGGCQSDPSAAVQVSSVPCVPDGVMGSLDCVTNSVWVEWTTSQGALSYTVVAQGTDGHNSSCFSTSNTCDVQDLHCGVLYNFSISASDGHCHSQPNTTLEIETAPCVLHTITAVTQCNTSTIQVMWDLMEGSPLYIATAEGSNHSMLSCNSTMSSCELTGVQCGTHYTIIVAASSVKCTSLRSPPFKINTPPCAVTDVVAHMDCESQSVLVSWAPSLVADSYHLTALGRDGDLQECKSREANCTLPELQCGQEYSISVVASAGNCTSPASSEVTINSVPCMPDGLSVDVDCGNSSAVLSWAESVGSTEYFACAQGENGDMLYCDTTDTSCAIEGLECGAIYNFSVMASDGVCNGSFSEPLQEGAAPCPPEQVHTKVLPMKAEVQVVRVSWGQVGCPNVTYLAEATGSIQDDEQQLYEMSSYWTDYTIFEFLLPCSSSYSITVKARNQAGTSQPSVAVTGITAPCPPLDVVFIESNSSTVISWNASVFATEYIVYEVSSTGRTPVCSTTALSCTVVNVNESAVDVTAKNSAGESNPTIEIQETVRHRTRRDLSEDLALGGLSAPQVKVTHLTASSLKVEWVRVTGATSYTLSIQEHSSAGPLSPLVLTATGEEWTVTGLTPRTKYCVSITAENPLNSSSPSSAPVCAVTKVQ